MANVEILHALSYVGTPPCETCAHYYTCKHSEIACRDFTTYVRFGSDIRAAVVSAKGQLKAIEEKHRKAKGKEAKRKCAANLRLKQQELDRLMEYGNMERVPDRNTFDRLYYFQDERAFNGRVA